MKKKTTVIMAAVLAAVIALTTGLAVLPDSVQDAQAQSCAVSGASSTPGKGFSSSESTAVEAQQGDIGVCSSKTIVTALSDESDQTTLNEEEDEYEDDYDYDFDYEYEYEDD